MFREPYCPVSTNCCISVAKMLSNGMNTGCYRYYQQFHFSTSFVVDRVLTTDKVIIYLVQIEVRLHIWGIWY